MNIRKIIIIAGMATATTAANATPGNSDLYTSDPFQPNFNPWHPDADLDNDGIINSEDPDMDGDGIVNGCDPNQDLCTEGTVGDPYWCAPCWWSPCLQSETLYPRSGGGVRPDENPDGDDFPNSIDDDDDNDGCPDVNDPDNPDYWPGHPESDMDGDTVPNWLDDDDDNDGCSDECDTNPCDPAEGGDENCPCDGDPEPPDEPEPPDTPEPPDIPDDPDTDPEDNPEDNPEDEPDDTQDPLPDIEEEEPEPPDEPTPNDPPTPPSDDLCCIAITTRLDILRVYMQYQSYVTLQQTPILHSIDQEAKKLYSVLVSADNAYLPQFNERLHFLQLSGNEQTENLRRLVTGQREQIFLDEIEFERSFLRNHYLGQILAHLRVITGFDDTEPGDPPTPDGVYTPPEIVLGQNTTLVETMRTNFQGSLVEHGKTIAIIDQLDAYTDTEPEAPLWEYQNSFNVMGHAHSFDLSMDFERFTLVKTIFWAAMISMSVLNSVVMIFEETRKY